MEKLFLMVLTLATLASAQTAFALKGVVSGSKECTSGRFICWPDSWTSQGGTMVLIPKHCEGSSSGAYTCKEDCERACK